MKFVTFVRSIFHVKAIYMASSHCHTFYQTKPTQLGVEASGIDLKTDISEDVIAAIKADVTDHRLVVFKDQGLISGKRQVEISQWFGELESTFYKHPKSPHPDVFRVANDNNEGCTGVGRTGWHIDGSFQPAPFAYSLYHIISVPDKGDTVFAPLNELINKLDPEKKKMWNRLWMASDRRSKTVHPLIYNHPLTGKETLCLHLGMTDAFVWDVGMPEERMTDATETHRLLQEINQEFVKDNKAIQYSHKWQAGDFIISDNLAVGHEASPNTQLPVSEVGLRVMHRTTVKGVHPPRKRQSQKKEELK